MSNATRWVAVDDADSSIIYNGPWFVQDGAFESFGTYGPTYRSSQHGTNGSASLSFTYTGRGLRVLGTSNIQNVSGVVDPAWDCILDNKSSGAADPWSSPENNWPICSATSIPEGQHTLTINAASNGRTFYIDQIRYQPAANMSASLLNPTVIVEHSDPSVAYSAGNWQALTNSVMVTLQAGSIMSVNFTGTKVTWVGWIPTGYPTGASKATYSIDGQTPSTFNINGLSAGSGSLYFQSLFETPTLSPGAHSLTVVHEGPSAPLALDYLLIQGGDIMLPSSSAPPITNVPDTPVPSSISNPSPSHSTVPGLTKKGAPTGAIVGGVVGGIALLAIFIFLFLILRKRMNRKGTIIQSAPQDDPQFMTAANPQHLQSYQVTPFSLQTNHTSTGNIQGSAPSTVPFNQPYQNPQYQNQLYQNQPYQNPSAGWSTASPPSGYSGDSNSAMLQNPVTYDRDRKINPARRVPAPQTPQDLYTRSHSPSLHPQSDASSSAGGILDGSSGLRPFVHNDPALVHHQDSGIRLPQSQQRAVDVPPSYTPD